MNFGTAVAHRSLARSLLGPIALGIVMMALPFLLHHEPRAQAILFDSGTIVVLTCAVLLFLEWKKLR